VCVGVCVWRWVCVYVDEEMVMYEEGENDVFLEGELGMFV